jgi:hypothetical protein
VIVATAVAFFFVIFVAAIANAGELCTASGANNVAGVDFLIKADGVAASRTFNFDKIVVAVAAVAIVIVAIAAITIVFVDLVVIFFERTEVFVDLFDVGFEIFGVFLQTADRVCNVAENVEDRGNNFIVAVKTFCKTFDVSNFFGNVHDFEPLYHARGMISFHLNFMPKTAGTGAKN